MFSLPRQTLEVVTELVKICQLLGRSRSKRGNMSNVHSLQSESRSLQVEENSFLWSLVERQEWPEQVADGYWESGHLLLCEACYNQPVSWELYKTLHGFLKMLNAKISPGSNQWKLTGIATQKLQAMMVTTVSLKVFFFFYSEGQQSYQIVGISSNAFWNWHLIFATGICNPRIGMLNKASLTCGGNQRNSSKNRLKVLLFWNIPNELVGKWLGTDFTQEINTEPTINLTLISGRWQCNGLFGWVYHSTKHFITNLPCLCFRCTVNLTFLCQTA